MFGYKRAAAAVLSLDQPLTDLAEPSGTIRKTPGIGPASTRVIREVLDTGGSPTVEDAVARSGNAAEIYRRRALRGTFFSRAQVLRILEDRTLEGPQPSDYHGDLQMHSEWSDGSPTLDEIVSAAIDRGWTFAAITDHSYGLKIAGGMSMEEAARQHQAIDRINTARRGSFRLIKGIEANIGSAGELDLSADEIGRFELVLAAPHSRLRVAEDQTARMIRAIRTPSVRILAHPRGRISGSRAGVVADWDAVFAAAAETGVAVELDGDPARQDLDYLLARRARDAGCLFALDSDAHTTNQFRYVDTAVAHARLAGLPPERIVNCWTTDRLLSWLA
ncbi:MAG TPA: DNA polymerase/3'-5' exonuclease PolX, partial [Vicinamibacterales bacterium]|nr:DNA polymerase/3'-5' exonuclease PolX [Vicinamibacterales bacterium]